MRVVSPESQGFSSSRLERVDALMERYVLAGKLAGTATLVARRGQVVHQACHGHADIEAGQPMAPDSIFRIYSMTKPITGVAIMMLYEAGHFLLDDPVAEYIPQLAEMQVAVNVQPDSFDLEPQATPITFRHLLTHTAGLTYGFFPTNPVETLYQQAQLLAPSSSLGEMVDKLAKLPLVGQPGQQWVYSVATDVLGYLVELISGQPLAQFLQERIFDPLGMVDTGFWIPAGQSHRLATLYAAQADQPLRAFQDMRGRTFVDPMAMPSGGGGLVSTISDYFRFCQMFLQEGRHQDIALLAPKTIRLMRQNHLPEKLIPIGFPSGPFNGYGHGLAASVVVDERFCEGLATNGTYSWSGAAKTHFWIDPQNELCAIFMTQLFTEEQMSLHAQFHTAVYQALME